MPLLEKFHELKNRLKKANMNISDFVAVISEIINCNTYLINAEGQILDNSIPNGSDCPKFVQGSAPTLRREFMQRMGFIFQTAENIPLETCFLSEDNCYTPNTFMTIVPVGNSHNTAGYLLLTKKNHQFSTDELILAEAASLLTSIYLKEMNASNVNPEPVQRNNVDMVLDSLSFSEIKAINCVLNELNGNEGFLVASKIADRIGISRSVIVNAMRKLESAGIVNSRSLGIKGTYIKVKNNYFMEALKTRVR